MVSFVALYRGPTIAAARLIAVSAEPALVTEVAARLLQSHQNLQEGADPDPVLDALQKGRQKALRLVAREGSQCSR